MCAITLCSVCPTTSGRVRNATTTTATRIPSSSQIGTTPPALCGGTPFTGSRDPRRSDRLPPGGVAVALARLFGPGPRLGYPAGEDEVLAQRMPLELRRE